MARALTYWRTFTTFTKTYLIVCGLRDVKRKWRHILGLPGSSKEIHEVVMKVPLKEADHKNQIIQNIWTHFWLGKNNEERNYDIIKDANIINNPNSSMQCKNNIPWDNFSHQAFGRVLNNKLLRHQVEGVECVNGELYENRTRGSRLSNGQRLPDRRHNFSDSPDGGAELTQRLEERHLVDILQRSSALFRKHNW